MKTNAVSCDATFRSSLTTDSARFCALHDRIAMRATHSAIATVFQSTFFMPDRLPDFQGGRHRDVNARPVLAVLLCDMQVVYQPVIDPQDAIQGV